MLTYLEDFVEFIAGYRTAAGTATNYPTPGVRLANYDYGIVESLARMTSAGTGYTDRQSALAQKLVHKYRRQLAHFGLDPANQLPLRYPIRQVDRRRRIIHDTDRNQLVIQFPFDAKLVEQLREFGNRSCGSVAFDREQRVWRVDATLPNTMWIWSWAQDNEVVVEFDIDRFTAELDTDIIRPQLVYNRDLDQYGIEPNVPAIDLAKLEFKETHVLKALSQSAYWQIGIHPDIVAAAEKNYLPDWVKWSQDRTAEINSTQISVDGLCDWLKALDVYPVWVHLSNMEISLEAIEQKFIDKFGEDNVSRSTAQRRKSESQIYFVESLNTLAKKIPPPRIIVTSQRIVYNIKIKYSNQAEKIVYYGNNHLVDIRNQ